MSKTSKTNNDFKEFLMLLFSLLAIWYIKELFDNDESKIISKRGMEILNNDKEMEKVYKELEKLKKAEGRKAYKEIVLD